MAKQSILLFYAYFAQIPTVLIKRGRAHGHGPFLGTALGLA